MSIAQLQSINLRRLEERAKAHARRSSNTTVYEDARQGSWVAGYRACIDDLQNLVNAAARPTDAVLASKIVEWLEGQP